MTKPNKVPKWLISSLFFGAIIVFLGLYVRKIDFANLTSRHISYWYFVAAVVLGIIYLYVGAYIWRVVLRSLGAGELPAYRVTTEVYAKAWMGRYIPGTVTWIAGKVYMAKSWGITKSRLSVASLIEAGAQVLASLGIAFVVLGFDSRFAAVPGYVKVSLVVLGFVVLLALIPAVFNTILMKALKVLGRSSQDHEFHINGRAVGLACGLYLFDVAVYGTACFLVARAVVPQLDLSTLWYVIGIVGLSNAAGMAVPIAPSGIGIKDSLLLILLTFIMPKEAAIVATVLMRVWSIVSDLLFLLLSVVSRRGQPQSRIDHAG